MVIVYKNRRDLLYRLYLDQSTNCSGWALFEGNLLIDSGNIDLNKISDTSIRIAKMIEEIYDLIDTHDIKQVVVEDTQFQNNIETLKILTRLQGAIIGHCLSKGIEFKITKPSEWRKILGFKQGRGVKREELKQQAFEYVNRFYDGIVSEDECEAICIGLAIAS